MSFFSALELWKQCNNFHVNSNKKEEISQLELFCLSFQCVQPQSAKAIVICSSTKHCNVKSKQCLVASTTNLPKGLFTQSKILTNVVLFTEHDFAKVNRFKVPFIPMEYI